MDRNPGVISVIKTFGYTSDCCLSRCTCDELPCPLLNWLTSQLKSMCPELQDSSGNRGAILVKELKNILSDLQSPLTGLNSEILEPTVLNKITEFLVSELLAAHIINYKELQSEDEPAGKEAAKQQRVKQMTAFSPEQKDHYANDDPSSAELQAEWILLLHALNMDASSQYSDVLHKVELKIAHLPGEAMTDPLLHSSLNAEQWIQLEKINGVLSNDYSCRQQMMVKRFQVSLESFAWGEKQKERSEAIASVPPLASIAVTSRVSLPLLLAAREDKSCIEPIKAGTSTNVYKKMMGHVPDRGGRPGEMEAPMPAWEGRRSGHGGGGHQWHKNPNKKRKGKRS
ncbi:protein FAM98B [Corythoichthys intestinalis]|uniref:protein FAM98B n=1 Tax=Corythoichthys intestinalis TaxID=161448 RepID=UPI0025A67100|nr:protein FAM98B [Corythoichthys intestinalis]XP_061797435.1 protein FAM98B-like [Nerophis lumbriciformis]